MDDFTLEDLGHPTEETQEGEEEDEEDEEEDFGADGLEWEKGQDGETVLMDRGKKRSKDKDVKKKKAKKTKVVEF